MKASTFAKFGIGLAAVGLVTCAFVAPAQADPSANAIGTLVGVGSDTTQDVMNGIATAVGGPSDTPRIASYNAVDPANNTAGGLITTRDGGTPFHRANGSGDGLKTLEVSIGALASATGNGGTWNSADTLGQVDFARSSSGPAATVSGGVVTYIPFARDAVDYATTATSDFPQLGIGGPSDTVDANGVGQATLYSIYHGFVTQIVVGGANDGKLVAKTYVAGAGETLVPIHAYIPQPGSGTRSFWEGNSVMAITDGDVDSKGIVFDHKVDGGGATTPTDDPSGLQVEEHDGTVLTGDPGAIMPFSVGKWIADANLGNAGVGVQDLRHDAVLGKLGGISPTTGSGTSYVLNADYVSGNAAVTRPVYNIVPTAEAANPKSLTNWAFVGSGSLVCSQKDVITRYGFGLLPTSGNLTCGDTSRQAILPSTPTVTLTAPASAAYGTKFTLAASVASFGNGGGTVTFTSGSTTLGTAKIAAGDTSASISVDTKTLGIGALPVVADFEPTLEGVAEASSSSAAQAPSVNVTKATPTIKASDASVSHLSASTVKVTATGSGYVPSGTVTVKLSTKTLATGTLSSTGTASIKIAKLSKGKHTLTVIYNGNTTTNAVTIHITFTSK